MQDIKKEENTENVAVIGASPKPHRYSNQAMRLLIEKGHNPVPVAPGRTEILGRKAYPTLAAVPDRIDTVTLYLRASRQASILDEVVRTGPRRVIFNPGTENPDAYDRLRKAGIEVVDACTLIMLCTNQF